MFTTARFAVQDVFSAGCVLAEMFLDGKLLFDRPQVPASMVIWPSSLMDSTFILEESKQHCTYANRTYMLLEACCFLLKSYITCIKHVDASA